MEMQIDAEFVKAERQKRGWSQEQLAGATGLGVRTVQRIESSKIASAESAKALAAVFEVPLTQIATTGSPQKPRIRKVRLLAYGLVASVALASTGLLVSSAGAAGVTMNVALRTEASGMSRMNIDAEDGKEAEIRLERDARLVLVPKFLKDGRMLLSIELYAYDGGEFKLVSTPKVLLENGTDTSLSLSLGAGRPIQISVTPREK